MYLIYGYIAGDDRAEPSVHRKHKTWKQDGKNRQKFVVSVINWRVEKKQDVKMFWHK